MEINHPTGYLMSSDEKRNGFRPEDLGTCQYVTPALQATGRLQVHVWWWIALSDLIHVLLSLDRTDFAYLNEPCTRQNKVNSNATRKWKTISGKRSDCASHQDAEFSDDSLNSALFSVKSVAGPSSIPTPECPKVPQSAQPRLALSRSDLHVTPSLDAFAKGSYVDVVPNFHRPPYAHSSNVPRFSNTDCQVERYYSFL